MDQHPVGGGVSVELPPDGTPAPLATGTPVCVWNAFLDRWTGGFTVAAVVPGGYRLRRTSDDHVFEEVVFEQHTVMPERRRVQLPGIEGTEHDRRRGHERLDPDAGRHRLAD